MAPEMAPSHTDILENSVFIFVFLIKHGNVGADTDNYYYGNECE